MKAKILQALAIATLIGGAFSGDAYAAGSASYSLIPSSGSYSQNSSFTVQVHENGSNVNTVTTKLTYDASKLSCTGVGGSSAFPQTITAACGSGTVTISRYIGPYDNPTTVSGDQIVGSVSFTVIASSGTAAISFAAGSIIADGITSGGLWNGSTTGGTYTLTAPVVPPPANTQPTQGSFSNKSSTSSKTASTKTSSNTANPPATGSTTDQPNVVADDTKTSTQNDTKSATVAAKTAQSKAARKVSVRDIALWIESSLLVLIFAGAGVYWIRRRHNQGIVVSATSTSSKTN